MIEIDLSSPVDNLCDYSFNFYWQNQQLNPQSMVPHQRTGSYTYQNLVEVLRTGGDICIIGDVGARFAYNMGVDLKHFGGTGGHEPTGRVFINGDIGAEAGMGMVGGILYTSGTIKEPMGNIIEVKSHIDGYRKFRSITDIMCNGLKNDVLIQNSLNETENTMTIGDGLLRGTIGARMDCSGTINVEHDAYNGTGLLMRRGIVHISGNAGLNTASRLDGGTVVVRGKADEFAGAYMKAGRLVVNNAKGYAGAGMTGGSIYSKKNLSVGTPATPAKRDSEDSVMLRRVLGIGRLEAMLYHKYEVGSNEDEYETVHMRDGSMIKRKI
ncbi:MAG: formylmethanofuran dehydrogenase [Candidatus Methanomarinus sp.]|uniref:Formylmethanofuran dehydrogenase n=1 Tax=Candidatus Methanomarinus sp. TaxID=3386244 RepID=A0AC61SCV5_9EURY|nr:MAG: formylmethanofuran dehydrogenase [ANME-2 cluster archaeon]